MTQWLGSYYKIVHFTSVFTENKENHNACSIIGDGIMSELFQLFTLQS